MRVLVVHNRYRLEGGEERSVELQVDALRRAGVTHALLERSSAEASRARAALALLRGGHDEDDVRAAASNLNADVVHAHNTLPLFGPRALEAAHAAGAAVDFIGRLDRPGMQRELRGAAMLLMPSRYHEFAGYSALEAMAAGVPVIGSRLGALTEILGAERCLPPNDPHAVAARMRQLWCEPERRRSDGEALMARARERHSERRYVELLLETYRRALE